MLAEVPEPAVRQAGSAGGGVRLGDQPGRPRHARTQFAASEKESGPAIAGLELAGVVIALGEGVTGFAVGDRVMAMSGRAWAERVTVDYRLAVPVPARFSWSEAAATPVSYITAHDCVTAAARLTHGESVLVQGATTAAGLAVLQLARTSGPSPSSARPPAPPRLSACAQPDATSRSCAGRRTWPGRRRAATDGHGADVVIDILGGTALTENVAAAAIQGRIICLGVSGPRGELDLDEFGRKRLQMTASRSGPVPSRSGARLSLASSARCCPPLTARRSSQCGTDPWTGLVLCRGRDLPAERHPVREGPVVHRAGSRAEAAG